MIASVLLRQFFKSWFYLYQHTLSNQVLGFEEDKINKPDRPIVRGLATIQGATIRYYCVSLFYALLSLFTWGVSSFCFALIWVITAWLHNWMGTSRYWFLKCLYMGTGTIALAFGCWNDVTQDLQGAPSFSWNTITYLGTVSMVLVPFLVSVQDLRDIEGDKLIGRNTLPIAIGERACRLILRVLFSAAPVVQHFTLFRYPNVSVFGDGILMVSYIFEFVIALLLSWIAYRVVEYRTKEEDHFTYMLFTYWFCLVLAGFWIYAE
jgi:4-hydroxybenzoate polyprenyltransferase